MRAALSKAKHTPTEYATLRKSGLNNTQIAEVLGVSEASVRRGLSKMKLDAGIKMLFIDIETAPALAYVWRVYDENIAPSQIKEATEVISWAAKWLGDDTPEFSSVFHAGKKKMIKRVWQLLDEADVVLHWNGRRFDIPHLNREFLLAGLTPPTPYKQIDLLATARQQFRFLSNRLDHVSREIGQAGKVEHEGFPLWLKCMEGDADAWERMKEYNIHDAVLLEAVYQEFRSWIPNHPNLAAFAGVEDVCPYCLSLDLSESGKPVITTTGRFPGLVCNSCGGHSRGTKRLDKTNIQVVRA